MLTIAQPVQESIVFNTTPENRRVITSEASDVGLSSGKARLRLKLSAIDHVNRFAIALLEDQDSSSPENDKWVYLYSCKGPVKAIISSIVRRLLIPESKVRTLAATISNTCAEFNPLNTALEDEIQGIIEKYEKKVDTVKCFLQDLEDDNSDGKTVELALKFMFVDLEKIRDDPDFNAIYKAVQVCFLNKDLYEMSKKEVSMLIDEFTTKLYRLDENFVLDAPRYKEKITDCKAWKDYPFLIGNYFKEDRIVGLNLVDDYPEHYGPRYVLKTDGYCYSKKPKMIDEHIPYTKDGKVWVLLSVRPLSRYLGIDVEVLKDTAMADENKLKPLVDGQISTLNQGVFHHKFFRDISVPTKEVSQEIFKYLDLSDLNALVRLNRQYKPDVDLTMLTKAREIGYVGSDVAKAIEFLKQDCMDIDEEIRLLCKIKIYPHQRIVYESWIFGIISPKKTVHNVKNFDYEELLKLFENEKIYPPFFMTASRELIKRRGKDALLLAARYGATDTISKLLENGVKVSARNSKGNTALHFAAYYGNEEAIKVLLKFGADVNSLNELGESPIFLAYNYENDNLYDVINLLTDNGADLDIVRKDGTSFKDFLSTMPGYKLLSSSVGS